MNNKPKRFISLLLSLIMVVCMLPSITLTSSATGYDNGYSGGMAGDGYIRTYGIDVSEHQGTGFNFQNLKNAGYTFVILRCGFVSRKDYRFEEYYAAAKAVGLDVGTYFYSYATTAAQASSEADKCLSYIQGKKFEYPVYFDFEDGSAQSYNGTLATQICNAFLSKIEAAGYLPGLYGYAGWMDPNYGAWVPTSSICSKWECWMANYYDGTPTNVKSANYPSTYGMYQYTSSNYVNGVGPLDTNVAYKDYPSIVKTYGFNGYDGNNKMVDPLVFNAAYYRSRYADLASYSDSDAQNHWINYGISEGRCASPVFDVKYYLANHADLTNAFGSTNYSAAIIHFVDNGVREGRQASENFNLNCYKNNYPDLNAAFGSDNYQYYKHYIDWGLSEKRVATKNLLNLPTAVYVLNSKGNSGFNLGMNGGGTVLATAAQTDAQRFALIKQLDNNYYYLIRNLESNLYLTAGSDGTTITQTAKTGGDNQKWHVIQNDDGSLTLWDFTNKKAVDISNGSYTDQNTVRLYSDNGTVAQRWSSSVYAPLADGVYSILCQKDTGFALDIYNSSTENSANLLLYTNSGNDNQKFAVYHNNDGFYTLRALHSDKCLDVTGASTELGANIAQYTDNGTVAQQWAAIPNENGSYTFASRCNGMVIDVESGVMENSTNIRCYGSNDTPAQQWVLRPVTTARVAPEGDLVLSSALDSSYAAEVNEAGSLVINRKDSTMDQVFRFTDLGNGYYAVHNAATGAVVKMDGGDICLGAVKGGTDASAYEAKEMWQLMPNGDGTVSVLSAVNGYYWNACGGTAGADVNIFPYHKNADVASRWNLEVSTHVHSFTSSTM